MKSVLIPAPQLHIELSGSLIWLSWTHTPLLSTEQSFLVVSILFTVQFYNLFQPLENRMIIVP